MADEKVPARKPKETSEVQERPPIDLYDPFEAMFRFRVDADGFGDLFDQKTFDDGF